jgi:hypothetical protein
LTIALHYPLLPVAPLSSSTLRYRCRPGGAFCAEDSEAPQAQKAPGAQTSTPPAAAPLWGAARTALNLISPLLAHEPNPTLIFSKCDVAQLEFSCLSPRSATLRPRSFALAPRRISFFAYHEHAPFSVCARVFYRRSAPSDLWERGAVRHSVLFRRRDAPQGAAPLGAHDGGGAPFRRHSLCAMSHSDLFSAAVFVSLHYAKGPMAVFALFPLMGPK